MSRWGACRPAARPASRWGFTPTFAKGNRERKSIIRRSTKLGDKLGRRPALVQGFYPWKNSDGTYCEFPQEFADYVVQLGGTPMITWQPGQADAQNHVEHPQAEWTCVED